MTLDQILDRVHQEIPDLVSSIQQDKEFLFFDCEGSLCGIVRVVSNGFNLGIEYQKIKDPAKRNENEKKIKEVRQKQAPKCLPSGD